MTETGWPRLAVTVVAATACAAVAAAQTHVPERGVRVFGLVGGALGEGTFLMSGGGEGLRLTRHLGLDLEMTHLTGETDWDSRDALSIFNAGRAGVPLLWNLEHYSSFPGLYEDRSVTTFLTKFTLECPVADERLFPYLTGWGEWAA